jgi:hypothetical protein
VASAVQARVHTAARLARLGPEALMAAVDRDVYATTDGALCDRHLRCAQTLSVLDD